MIEFIKLINALVRVRKQKNQDFVYIESDDFVLVRRTVHTNA